MNTNEIKFRCSSLAHLMVEPRNKSETISESTKTHVVDVWVSNKYNRFTEINGKQLDKGNEVEEDGITTISRMTKQFFKKNTEFIENDFIKGTPDLYLGESINKATVIRDAKCPYEIFSFNRSKNSDLKKIYYWQMHGYMALTGANVAYVDFCLINTPFHILERELYYESKKHTENDTPAWIELQIIANHVYDKKTFEEYIFKRGLYASDDNAKAVILGFIEVPLNERYFSFEVKRNDEDISRLYNRIIECRQWIKENLEVSNGTK